ncbi:MAG: hypothetical protein Q7T71_17680 [Herbiconiux sp.]|nr:hypothetical protein [Herbiconiux sp.]
MGTNRRYADKIDRQMSQRIEEVNLRPQYESLPPSLSGIEHDRPQPSAEPVPVTVWVGVTAGKVKIEAEAVEWNRKAARVVWKDAQGNENSVWVYLGAITRR